jgi:hypothetical protein
MAQIMYGHTILLAPHLFAAWPPYHPYPDHPHEHNTQEDNGDASVLYMLSTATNLRFNN